MAGKVFRDSNIWLYLFLKDDTNKCMVAEEYISKNAQNSMFITYQVINEVTNQLIQNNFSETIIKESIEYMYKICTIHNFSKEIILLASSLREKHSISFWDSIIIASALNSGCSTLATEDMHDGLKIENMVIKNIFKKT
jgi:predicted nucleic acid-binding protein